MALKLQENQFKVRLKHGESLRGDRILLATGSSARGYQLAKSLSHEIITPLPSLFTFKIKDSRFQGLEGISVDSVGL